MLEKFRNAKQREIEQLKNYGVPNAFLKPRTKILKKDSSQKIGVIAEYKRASPSRGIIRQNLNVEEIASQYMQAGASALSILTEQEFFDGDMTYIERAYVATNGKIPILRKDFIFHQLQIAATAATPASALLLISRFMEGSEHLQKLREEAENFGMDAVVEIFDERDLEMARNAGARIIQMNARDLDTLKVNRLGCIEFIKKHQPQAGELWIAASGIKTGSDIQQASQAGYDYVLVGTSLMESPHPGRKLAELKQYLQ